MEMIENPMVMPKYDGEYESIPDDIWDDMESDAYDDMIFEEMTKE